MSDPVRVPASPAHCRWGAFDASFAPVASIDPGGLVILECLSGGPEVMPRDEQMLAVPPMLREVHAKLPRLGAHIITGPVEVRGADVEVTGRPFQGLDLSVGYSFLETEHLENSNQALVGAAFDTWEPRHTFKAFAKYTPSAAGWDRHDAGGADGGQPVGIVQPA